MVASGAAPEGPPPRGIFVGERGAVRYAVPYHEGRAMQGCGCAVAATLVPWIVTGMIASELGGAFEGAIGLGCLALGAATWVYVVLFMPDPGPADRHAMAVDGDRRALSVPALDHGPVRRELPFAEVADVAYAARQALDDGEPVTHHTVLVRTRGGDTLTVAVLDEAGARWLATWVRGQMGP